MSKVMLNNAQESGEGEGGTGCDYQCRFVRTAEEVVVGGIRGFFRLVLRLSWILNSVIALFVNPIKVSKRFLQRNLRDKRINEEILIKYGKV